MTFLVKFIFFSLCCLCATIHAKDSEKGIEFFENKIRPVLAEHCYECHSAKSEKLKGGLLLDRSEGWKRGGRVERLSNLENLSKVYFILP